MNGFGVINVVELAGGLALFLYGINQAVEALRKATGHRLRSTLTLLTGNRPLGTIAGVAVTLGLQSSSATTVMLVGLSDAGLITLKQCIAVIVGAAIGTTFTVQIIAFDMAQYGLIPLFVGFLLYSFARRDLYRSVSRMLMGFGFVFYGMHLMKTGASPLAGSEAFLDILARMAHWPIYSILAATIFTAMVQSSAATLAVAMSLAGLASAAESGSSGDVSLMLVVPLVLGANLGTCATAGLASLQTGRRGKQVAMAHVLIKFITILLILPFMEYFSNVVVWITDVMTGGAGGDDAPAARWIANAHTMFAVVLAIVILPLTNQLVALIRFVLKTAEEEPYAAIKSLERSFLKTPELAIERARQELVKCVVTLIEMFDGAKKAVLEENAREMEHAVAMDDMIDMAVSAIIDYLARLETEKLSGEDIVRRDALLYTARHVEYIGDVISKEIGSLTSKYIDSGSSMSIEGVMHLKRFWDYVAADIPMVRDALEKEDPSLAQEVVERENEIAEEKKKLHAAHLERLTKSIHEERHTSAVYMDLVAAVALAHYYLAETVKSMPKK